MKRLGLLALPLLFACDLGGGLNQNQKQPGNEDDGTKLAAGDIAIDPSGEYFLSRVGSRLLKADLAGERAELLNGIEDPERVIFGGPNEIFVTVASTKGDRLFRYDVGVEQTQWNLPIEIQSGATTNHGILSYPLIEISEDAAHIVLTHPRRVDIVDTKTGTVVRSEDFNRIVVDIDVLPGQNAVIATLDHKFNGDDPETVLARIPFGNDDMTTIKVPNCSDELAVAPDGKYAFLAPTQCQKDPVSVIDLQAQKWEKNLPGFGPVALAPDGHQMVAFMDTEALDESLFDDPSQIPSGADQYHLMLIDSTTLEFNTVPVGDKIPRYAMTRDGKMVLVDSPGFFDDARIRVLDVETLSLDPVDGPDVTLENWVLSQDSTKLFLLDGGLFGMDIPERFIEAVATDFEPQNLNMTKDDAFLLLREDDNRVWVYDVAGESMLRAVTGPGKSAKN